MNVSCQQMEMLEHEVEKSRDFREQTAKFQGRVEGSIRVVQAFLTIGTTGVGALCVLVWNSVTTLNSLKDKMDHFDPVQIQLMQHDIADIQARINTLEKVAPRNHSK